MDTSSGFEEIVAEAGLELYESNPFRVCRLPVTAEGREVHRQIDRLRQRARLTEEAQASEDKLRRASQRLADPRLRLVDEFFWYWPIPSGSQQSAWTGTEGPAAGVLTEWQRMGNATPPDAVALHNLAVYAHRFVLEAERRVQGRGGDVTTRESAWGTALAWWRLAIGTPSLWSAFAAMQQERHDPCPDAVVRELRAAIRPALLSTNRRLLSSAMEQVDAVTSGLHVRVVRAFAGEDGDGEAIIRAASERAIRVLRQLCEHAEEGEGTVAPGPRIAQLERFIMEATRRLAVVTACLGKAHPLVGGLADAIAATVRSGLVPYADATRDWTTCVRLLRKVEPLARDEDKRAALLRDIQTVERNLEAAACWFCAEPVADDGSKIGIDVFGNIRRVSEASGTRVHWQHTTIDIPRCPACARRHSRVSGGRALVTVGGLGLTLAACVSGAMLSIAGSLFATGVAAFAAAAGYFACRRILGPVKEEREKWKYPRLASVLKEGWRIGSGPTS